MELSVVHTQILQPIEPAAAGETERIPDLQASACGRRAGAQGWEGQHLGGNAPVTAKYIAERANMLPHAVLSMGLEGHPEIANYDSQEDEDGESLVDILDSFEFSDDGIPF